MDLPREVVRERLGAQEAALGDDLDLFGALPVPVRGRVVEGVLSGALDRERARELLTPALVASRMGDLDAAAGLVPAPPGVPWPPPAVKRRIRELNRHLDELRTFGVARYGLMFWGGKDNYLAALREQDAGADRFARSFVRLLRDSVFLADLPDAHRRHYPFWDGRDVEEASWACSRARLRRRAQLASYVRAGAHERMERELGLDPAAARADEADAAELEILGDIEDAIRESKAVGACAARLRERAYLVAEALHSYEHALLGFTEEGVLRGLTEEGIPPLRMMEYPEHDEERVARSEAEARASVDLRRGRKEAVVVRRVVPGFGFPPDRHRAGVSWGDAEEEHALLFRAARHGDKARETVEAARAANSEAARTDG